MFAVLKPGGFLVIADHSALPGQGTSVGKTLHRIEESTLRKEVEAAIPRRCRGQFLATSRRHTRLSELPADHAGR